MRRFFIDTNIIISYVNREDPRLNAFIDRPDHRFYYTETVRDELKCTVAPPVFIYIESGVSMIKKSNILTDVATALKLTATQTHRFKNDLWIATECGYVAPDFIDIADGGGIHIPPLITNNMKFIRKIIDKYGTQIDECINKHGCEHLCDFVAPSILI